MPLCSTPPAAHHLRHLRAAPKAGARPGTEQLVAAAGRQAQGHPLAELTAGWLLTLPQGSPAISGSIPWVTAPQPDPNRSGKASPKALPAQETQPDFVYHPRCRPTLPSQTAPTNITHAATLFSSINFLQEVHHLSALYLCREQPASHPTQTHRVKGTDPPLFGEGHSD